MKFLLLGTKENEKLNIPQHKGKIIKIAKNHYCFKSEYITIDQLQNEYETQQEKNVYIIYIYAFKT